MRLHLSADEVLTTTRAVRRRLDLERPVEREIIDECIDIAIQAPSGGNTERWHWVFVDDPGKKAAIADVCRQVFASFGEGAHARDLDAAGERMRDSGQHLLDHLHEVPVLLVPCHWGRGDGAGYWASILPAAWSFMLAGRERGLGTVYTALHLQREEEVAEILGIPYERCAQAGLIPVAYTKGTEFRPGARTRTRDQIVHWNEW